MPNLHQRQGEGPPVGGPQLKTPLAELVRRREKYQPKTGIRGRGRYLKERSLCSKGHPFEGRNLIIELRTRPDGSKREVRRCRICVRANAADSRLRNLENRRRQDRLKYAARRDRNEAQAVADGALAPDLFMDLLILDLKAGPNGEITVRH